MSQWYYPIIASPVAFFLCLISFPASFFFFPNELVLPIRWSKYWSFSISPSNEYPGLISFRIDLFYLLSVQGNLKSLLQNDSSKTSILQLSAFFMVQHSHSYMTTRKSIALFTWIFDGKVMSLLFNMLSRFVIAFLPKSKLLLISWLHSPSAVMLESKKRKSVSTSILSPSICHKVKGLDTMIFFFWMSILIQFFHSTLSLSRSSSVPLHCLPLEWYHLHIWGCWYFSQPSCDSSSQAFLYDVFCTKIK